MQVNEAKVYNMMSNTLLRERRIDILKEEGGKQQEGVESKIHWTDNKVMNEHELG